MQLTAAAGLFGRARTETLQTGRWLLFQALPTVALKRMARQGEPLARFIIDPVVRANPRDVLTDIRASGDIAKARIGHVTASHAVVREVLRRDDMLVGAFEEGMIIGKLAPLLQDAGALGPIDPPSMLITNAPEHTRYRRLVSKVFTAKAVDKLQERTEVIAADLLDSLAADTGIVDLVPRYAAQLPVTVICEMLGVPLANRDLLLRLGEGAAASLDIGLDWARYRLVQSSLREFNAWMDSHLAALRAHPGEDLLSQLVVGDGGEALTELELRSIAGLLLVAGFETTVNIIGSGAYLLLDNPDQLAVLQEREDLWGNAIEEALRLAPPVQATSRIAAEDTVVAGKPVAARQAITCLIIGANTDPQNFPDPFTFDVARPNAREHLAFSGGRHFCLGSALARMEATVALRALFTRYPQIELAGPPVPRETRALQGLASLPVRLVAPARAA